MDGAATRQKVRESRFWQAYLHQRYGILFYALLVTLVVVPITTTIGLPASLIRIPLAACLFAARAVGRAR